MQIEPLNPHRADARALLAQSDAYMAALYPAESNHLEGPEALAQTHVFFFGGTLDGELVACGGIKLMRDADGQAYGEIKRVFVLPAQRGRGLSRRMMARLEQTLQAQGIALARLETGIHQPEAIALYRKLGYVERPPFGSYAPDPLSLFMEKRLR